MYDLDVVLDAHSDFQDAYIYVSVPSEPLDSPLHVTSDHDGVLHPPTCMNIESLIIS